MLAAVSPFTNSPGARPLARADLPTKGVAPGHYSLELEALANAKSKLKVGTIQLAFVGAAASPLDR